MGFAKVRKKMIQQQLALFWCTRLKDRGVVTEWSILSEQVLSDKKSPGNISQIQYSKQGKNLTLSTKDRFGSIFIHLNLKKNNVE